MIHIDVSGSGDANVVLFHGSPTPPAIMEGLARELAGSYRVHLVHGPGYGASEPPRAAYTMADDAEWVEEALLAKGVREAALVGYSIGAYRSLHLLARGKLQSTGAVAIGGFADLPTERREAYRHFAGALRQGADLSSTLVDFMLSPEQQRASPELVSEVRSWMQATTPTSLAWELEALAALEDLLPSLREISVPCLALAGELDQVVPPEWSRKIAETMPRGEFHLLPEVAHLPLHEDLAGTAAAVKAFLDRSTAVGNPPEGLTAS